MTDIQELKLSVPDMSCGHCVQTINSTLGQLSGVEQAVVDLPTKTVQLRYQPETVSVQQIESALDEAGYTVTH